MGHDGIFLACAAFLAGLAGGCGGESTCSGNGPCDVTAECGLRGDARREGDVAAPSCPDAAVAPCPDAAACPEVPASPCAACGPTEKCLDGHCYNCEDEGFCNAVECEEDGNPCTLQVVSGVTGKCMTVVNEACREPVRNLIRIFRGAQVYYTARGSAMATDDQYPSWPPTLGTTVPLVQGDTPSEGDCCPGHGADQDGDSACDPDHLAFRTAVWGFLGFGLAGAHRFVYSFEETGEAGVEGNAFEIRAKADLDCDGHSARFVLHGDLSTCGWDDNVACIVSPEWFEYLGEDAAPGMGWMVPALWAYEQFMDEGYRPGPADPFAPRPENTYFGRFAEPIENLARLYVGALRYYRIPKAESGAPPCQVSAGDTKLLATLGGELPPYDPLVQGPTPVEQDCCDGGGVDNDGNNLCDSDTGTWSTNAWSALGFQIVGEHAWWYSFYEGETGGVPPFEGEEVSFVIEAKADPDCDGIPVRFALRGALGMEGGKCHPWPSEKYEDSGYLFLPEVEFFPLDGDPVSVVIPLSWTVQNALWGEFLWAHNEWFLPPIWSPESFNGAFNEVVANLAELMTLAGKYYATHCFLPMPSPSLDEWFVPTECCNKAVHPSIDGWKCGPFPEVWTDPMWLALGFAILTPHQYGYSVTVKPLANGKELITVDAVGDQDCDGSVSLFQRFGVASKVGDACFVQWLEGWHIENMWE